MVASPKTKAGVRLFVPVPKECNFVYAGRFYSRGACLQQARGHIHFFPETAAGWDDDNPYWCKSRFEAWIKDPPSYVTQDLRTTPFAYPTFSKRNQVGNQVITYPPSLTADLIIPIKRLKPLKKRKRKAQVSASGEDDAYFKNEDTTKGSEDDADVIANQMQQMERRHALVRELNQQKF